MEFDDLINIIYLLKLFYNIDKDKFKKVISFDVLELNEDGYFYDFFYETVFDILNSIFEYLSDNYFDYKEIDLFVFSDSVIEDFYKFAGEYGELKGISEEDNQYFVEAMDKMQENFSFSYSLDWVLKGYAKPKRKFHSRFALIIDQYEFVDVCGMAIGLLNMYIFFKEKRDELFELLHKKEALAS